MATLGCKVNQFESAAIEELARARGYDIVPFTRSADAYIINTCSVTAKADFQSRQLIRRAMRTNPSARVLVTGCYVQTAVDDFSDFLRFEDICLVGNGEKYRILDYIEPDPVSSFTAVNVGAIENTTEIAPFRVSTFPRHTRAFLRIQDGCNVFCSYCVVPYARGRSRSLDFQEVIHQAERLAENGYREIVLTGINLGAYGKDLKPGSSLLDVVQELEKKQICRIRLSSIEPAEISHELIKFIKESKYICPHFHVPLQSGSTAVLKEMNRNYTPEDYAGVIEEIHRSIPDAAIGTDVMVGFPGESEKEFEDTEKLISSLPISYLHVFRYSQRKGTRAVGHRGQVAHQAATARAKKLQELGTAKRKGFYLSNLGRKTSLLIEGRHKNSRLFKGLTPNYIPVLIEKEPAASKIVNVTLCRVLGDQVIGAVEDVARKMDD